MVVSTTTFVFTYSTIVVCSFHILRTLRGQSTSMAPKTIKLQRSLNNLLLAQVIIPSIIYAVPSFICIVMLLLNAGSMMMSNLSSMFVCWVPLVSPVCSLYFLPSYKRRFCSLLRGQIRDQQTLTERISTKNIRSVQVIEIK